MILKYKKSTNYWKKRFIFDHKIINESGDILDRF